MMGLLTKASRPLDRERSWCAISKVDVGDECGRRQEGLEQIDR